MMQKLRMNFGSIFSFVPVRSAIQRHVVRWLASRNSYTAAQTQAM
jgi:hypothetical protein